MVECDAIIPGTDYEPPPTRMEETGEVGSRPFELLGDQLYGPIDQ